MIPLDLSLGLGIYLLIGVAVLVLLWVWGESRRRPVNLDSRKKRIWVCSLCFHRYIDSRAEDYSRCPRCGNLNEKVKS